MPVGFPGLGNGGGNASGGGGASGVGQLVAGTGISLSPVGGTGTVTVSATTNGGNVTTSGSITSGQSAQWTGTTALISLPNTGTGNNVLANTPTLITPVLGVASATSINGLTITQSTGTVTIANGKTLTQNNSITHAGTDATTMTYPSTSATLARTDAANTFTGHQTIEGVTTTGATGTGNLVFSAAPTFSGIIVYSGSNVTTANALAGTNAIDVTKGLNTTSISAASSFTFSGTPGTSNTWFSLKIGDTGSAGTDTVTIPASFSVAQQASITSIAMPSPGTVDLTWLYDGVQYNLFGEPIPTTGTSSFVRSTSPTLVTPVLGAASATSINGLTITSSTGTLSITNGKTLAASNSITLAGTDATTMTFPPASASVGYLNLPQNSQITAYTTVLGDSGKHILHPSSDSNTRTFTIDSNANVAYAVGTALTFAADGASAISIAITTDTMELAGSSATGTRTLTPPGIATALKIGATRWIISGTGLT